MILSRLTAGVFFVVVAATAAVLSPGIPGALASHHYTARQLEVLAERVGKTFWVTAADNRTPTFQSAPSIKASSFRADADQSFFITELAGQKEKNPYYKVKFDSGKEGYIRPDLFLEELNLTILTLDPRADEKRQAAEAAEEEKKRLAWIQAQPWPQAVRDSAIKRRVVPGLNMEEVKRVLGKPARVIKVKGQRVAEEHWHYIDGSILVFQNRLLSRTETSQKKAP